MNAAVRTGKSVLRTVRELGASLLLGLKSAKALGSSGFEWREALRQTRAFGVASLVVLCATSALIGGMLVVQVGIQVRRFGIHELVGWFVGFGVLRELGPLVIGLTFSGRVGSRNAAELAAMKTREQLAGLEAMGIDVVPTVIAPRAWAMGASLVCLYALGALVGMVSGALFAWMLLGIDPWQFVRSFEERTELVLLWSGLAKITTFAAAIAIVSCRAGLEAKGGAAAVGQAARRAVVQAAFALVVLDLVVSRLL